MELGSMHIVGTIDTNEIDRGLIRIEGELSQVSEKAKGVQSDWIRMETSVKGLASSFGIMAIAGTAAMVGIAKGAPALAPAMASMEVSMMGLKFAMGEALQPAFDWMAEKLQWLVGWANENPDIFSGIVTSIGGLAVAFTAFKIGGMIEAGIVAIVGTVTSLSALLTNPVFLVGVAALTALLVLWNATQNLAKSAAQSDALRPYGSVEKSYSPEEMQGTRQFGSQEYDKRAADILYQTLLNNSRQQQLINQTNAVGGSH